MWVKKVLANENSWVKIGVQIIGLRAKGSAAKWAKKETKWAER